MSNSTQPCEASSNAMSQTVLGTVVGKNHPQESDPGEPAKGLIPLELQANKTALSSSEETGVMVPVQASEDKVLSSEQDEMVICGECGGQVSPFELPEHLDFHYAQQLQKEGGKAVVRTVFLPSAGKRKREGGASKSDRANKKKSTGDISSFFSKK
jgi:hypothetical protein